MVSHAFAVHFYVINGVHSWHSRVLWLLGVLLDVNGGVRVQYVIDLTYRLWLAVWLRNCSQHIRPLKENEQAGR